jgi:hypothetical protein
MIKGSGIIKSQKRALSNVKYIVNDGSAKIVLSYGNTEEATIETDDNLIDHVKLENKGGKLYVTTDNVSFNSKRLVVYITLKELKGLKTRGSGNISTKGQIKSKDLMLLVEGSGDINIVNVISDKITVAVFGSGDVTLSGETKELNAEIAGSGDVKANLLEAKDAYVKIGGSGDVSLDAWNQLSVKISGSGDVTYVRNPRNLSTSISGSGDVRYVKY